MLMETISSHVSFPVSYFMTSICLAYYIYFFLHHIKLLTPKRKNMWICMYANYGRIISTATICVFCISAPSSRKPGDPLVISDIKKGSVAHR